MPLFLSISNINHFSQKYEYVGEQTYMLSNKQINDLLTYIYANTFKMVFSCVQITSQANDESITLSTLVPSRSRDQMRGSVGALHLICEDERQFATLYMKKVVITFDRGCTC